MEWTIPAKTFIPANVIMTPPNRNEKPFATLSYNEEDVNFPYVSIFLPPLPVKSYDADTGKLALSLAGNTSILNKLVVLQNRILQKIQENYSTWFPSEHRRGFEDMSHMFQPLIHNNCIHLYCPLTTVGSFNEIGFFSGTSWSKGVIPSTAFTAGSTIRAAVRLQSISFHQHPLTKELTGRFRIQHRILALFKHNS